MYLCLLFSRNCRYYYNDHISFLKHIFTLYLHDNICNDHKEWIEEIKEEPYFYWFDVWSAREGGGDREVDRGEDHHAGDVHCDYQVLARVRGKVDNCLVDDIHQDSWQICNQENICTFFRHVNIYCIISP